MGAEEVEVGAARVVVARVGVEIEAERVVVVVEKAAALQALPLSQGGCLRQRRYEGLEGGVVQVQRCLQRQCRHTAVSEGGKRRMIRMGR